jgi:aldehyde:ferredoxin oxidoreductase
MDHLPEIVRWHEDVYAIADSLGFCAFICTSALAVTPRSMAEIFSFATGFDMTEKEMMLTGRRILTLEKCYNVREGATRKMDDLSWRAMNEPVSEGPLEGMVASQEWLDDNLDRYYKLHMWDLETSWPYKETLNMLGLVDVAGELEKLGKIPRKE